MNERSMPASAGIHHLSLLQLGIDPDGLLQADGNHRIQKAELRAFNVEVKRFTKKAAYIVGSCSNSKKRLEKALELARQALMRAEADLEWEVN